MHLIRCVRYPTYFLIDLSIPKILAIFIQANFFVCPSLYSGMLFSTGMDMIALVKIALKLQDSWDTGGALLEGCSLSTCRVDIWYLVFSPAAVVLQHSYSAIRDALYHLCNLKNLKNTHRGLLLLVKFQLY